MVSSFTPLKGQGRAPGVILSDSEGQQWLVFVVHFPNDLAKQQKLWTCLRQERQRFAGTPAVVLGDMNSIVHPPWDNLSQFLTNVPLSESVNIQRAREPEIASMLTMGLQDTRRRVHPEPKVAEEIGPTRGDRRIDRILLPPCVSEHIQSVFTTPVGRADH